MLIVGVACFGDGFVADTVLCADAKLPRGWARVRIHTQYSKSLSDVNGHTTQIDKRRLQMQAQECPKVTKLYMIKRYQGRPSRKYWKPNCTWSRVRRTLSTVEALCKGLYAVHIPPLQGRVLSSSFISKVVYCPIYNKLLVPLAPWPAIWPSPRLIK